MSEGQRKLARVQERLQASDVSAGLARELSKHLATLKREIAELEQA
jgi:hypothetical protein